MIDKNKHLDQTIEQLNFFFGEHNFKINKRYWYRDYDNGVFRIYFKLRRRTDYNEHFYIDYGFFIKEICKDKNVDECSAVLDLFKEVKYKSGIILDQNFNELKIDVLYLKKHIEEITLPLLYKVANLDFLREHLPKDNNWKEDNLYLKFIFDWKAHKKMLDYMTSH